MGRSLEEGVDEDGVRIAFVVLVSEMRLLAGDLMLEFIQSDQQPLALSTVGVKRSGDHRQIVSQPGQNRSLGLWRGLAIDFTELILRHRILSLSLRGVRK